MSFIFINKHISKSDIDELKATNLPEWKMLLARCMYSDKISDLIRKYNMCDWIDKTKQIDVVLWKEIGLAVYKWWKKVRDILDEYALVINI